jgi:DNA-directed RNA polymerase subunit K/omega
MDEGFEDVFSDDSENDYYDEEENKNMTNPNELDINEFYKNYEKNKKLFKTSPVLSKYEKTRIISERVQQLSNGSPAFINNAISYSTVHDIALKELSMKKLPFIIKRTINGKTYELWKLEDLKIIN